MLHARIIWWKFSKKCATPHLNFSLVLSLVFCFASSLVFIVFLILLYDVEGYKLFHYVTILAYFGPKMIFIWNYRMPQGERTRFDWQLTYHFLIAKILFLKRKKSGLINRVSLFFFFNSQKKKWYVSIVLPQISLRSFILFIFFLIFFFFTFYNSK